mmetsp:Transcript_5387/g.7268  ORF Transcript_5387/g.7268 Transcript_5387/m.7268 type:complete len:269 (-) Transcript_5387:355-1161(-)
MLVKILKLVIASLWALAVLGNVNPHSIDGRHSFSLSTFDTDGRLQQVENAVRASTLGVPILICKCDETAGDEAIVFVSPHSHALPSPLIRDVGTSRMIAISRDIAIAHSGVGADGRVLLEEVQRIAVNHAYMYGEEIPIDRLLYELTRLFQEYTIKPGARPYGCTLVVAYLNSSKGIKELYRVNPAGMAEAIDGRLGVLGKISSHSIISSLEDDSELGNDIEKTVESLISTLKHEYRNKPSQERNERCMSFIVGKFSKKSGFSTKIMR